MTKAYDLTGQRFGRLVAVERAGHTKDGTVLWQCHCDCGKEKAARTSQLVGGRCKSCGCLNGENRKTHGHASKGPSRTRTYKAWAAMKRRCDNANEDSYPRYGGRGITYDPRWGRFEAFLADMGICEPGMSLERIDPNGNYGKENCRWIPLVRQSANRRNTVYFDYQGERRSLEELSQISGLNRGTISWRIRHLGWTVEQAVSTPLDADEEQITYDGRTQSIAAWARDVGVSYMTLYLRLKRRGWTIERALTTPARRR